MIRQPASTLWVCDKCLLAREGEPPELRADEPEPWALYPNGADVTMGLLPEEHHEDCDFRLSEAQREVEEMFEGGATTERFDCNLGCESQAFLNVDCYGCGSTLAGSRHAYTLWETVVPDLTDRPAVESWLDS